MKYSFTNLLSLKPLPTYGKNHSWEFWELVVRSAIGCDRVRSLYLLSIYRKLSPLRGILRGIGVMLGDFGVRGLFARQVFNNIPIQSLLTLLLSLVTI